MGPQGNGFDLSDLDDQSQVLLVGGGIGVPPLLEVAKELHARGVKVVTVLGFANKDAVILETELTQYGQVFVTTDDGSYGIKGNVSVVINDLDSQFDAVYSCGALYDRAGGRAQLPRGAALGRGGVPRAQENHRRQGHAHRRG